MAKTRDTLETWAQEFLRSRRPRTPDELRKGREAFERAWANREKLDIRPLTTTELVRAIREEH